MIKWRIWLMQIDGKERKLVELSLQSCRCLFMLVKAYFSILTFAYP
jgi:hypothetical protein